MCGSKDIHRNGNLCLTRLDYGAQNLLAFLSSIGGGRHDYLIRTRIFILKTRPGLDSLGSISHQLCVLMP